MKFYKFCPRCLFVHLNRLTGIIEAINSDESCHQVILKGLKIAHRARQLKEMSSVTRFGKISPLRPYFKLSLAFLEQLFSIWQNCEPILTNILYFGANFHCSKQPNIEKVMQPSCQTGDEGLQWPNCQTNFVLSFVNCLYCFHISKHNC